MVPRPRMPEPRPEAGGSNSDDAIDQSDRPAGTINATGTAPIAPLAASPTRRARRSRDAAAAGDAHDERSAAAAAKYEPSSGMGGSLRRHVLSPIGGGRVARRPVVQRSLRRICTLALPSLHPDDNEHDAVDTGKANGAADQPQPQQQKGGAAASVPPMSRQSSFRDSILVEKEEGDSDARSVSSRLSLATGTTAPATNTTAGGGGASSVAHTFGTAMTGGGRDQQQQQQQQQQNVEQSFPPPRASFAPGCSPQIVFRRYIVAATDDGRVCMFAVKQFEDNLDIAGTAAVEEDGPGGASTMNDDAINADVNPEMEEDWGEDERLRQHIDRIEDEKDAVKPVAIVGPFRVGGGLMSQSRGKVDDDSDSFPSYIAALTATPAHIPLPFYRRRKKRRRPGDTTDNKDDDTAPPPPPSKPGHDFLGHVAVLTAEGDVHILEVHEAIVSDAETNPPPSVEVLTSFSSMEYCATSICLRPSPNGDEDSSGNGVCTAPSFRVCIGHESGLIAEFEVVVTVDTPLPLGGAAGIRRPLVSPRSSPQGAATKQKNDPDTTSKSDGADPSVGARQKRDVRPPTPPSSPTNASITADDEVDAVSAAAGALDKIATAHHRSKRREGQSNDVDSVEPLPASADEVSGAEESSKETASIDETAGVELQDEHSTQTNPKQPPQLPPLRYSLPRSRLMWAGKLDAPIRNLSSVGGGSAIEDGELATFRRTHLVVGLLQRARPSHDAPIPSTPPPSSAVEVLRADLAEAEWGSTRSGDSGFSLVKGLDPIPLDSFCTWPGAGMEIPDGSVLPALQGDSSDYMAARVDKDVVRADCFAMCDGVELVFALSLSDGTMATIHSVKQSNSVAAWGLAHSYNQIFLPGAAVGTGFFCQQIGGAMRPQYTAYCLQGGIVFVTPVVSPIPNAQNGSPQVLMYQCPLDPEGGDDDAIQFVHGFVAGDIAIRELDTDAQIVAFSWPGGMLDVFRCGGMFARNENKLAQSNERREGVIGRLSVIGEDELLMLIRKLLSTGEDDELLNDELWQEAWEECRSTFRRSWEEGEHEDPKGTPETILEGIQTQGDSRFTNMRELLWLFAKNGDE